jgi:hypothetical protein
MPVYEPPADLSPAIGRHLLCRNRVDGKSIVATLVRLAQAGAVHIRERDGRYRLYKRGADLRDCAPHEIEFFRRLFDGTSEVMVGTADARRRLRAARAAMAKALRGERAKYIVTNRRYLWPAALLSLAGIALAVLVADEVRGDAGVWHVVVMFAVATLLNLTFWPLLKAPTPAAGALIGELRGFKAFLDVSYRDGVAAHLAYAIAFDVEHERASILDREIDWYTGTSGGFSAGDFTRSLYRLIPLEAHA